MRKRIVLLGLIFILITVLHSALQQDHFNPFKECEGSECGKVVGQILDPNTKKPVKERFKVYFLDCREKRRFELYLNEFDYWAVISDENGHFSMKLEEGKYCIMIDPISFESKYAKDPLPGCSEKDYKINVKRGKITEVKKVAHYGGKITLKFVNKIGNSVNLKKVFCDDTSDDTSIDINLKANNITPIYCFSFNRQDDFFKGEVYEIKEGIKRLFPGTYKGIVNFDTCKSDFDYGSYVIPEIIVKEGEETVVPVEVDPEENKTGIEFEVTNKNGKHLENVSIKITGLDEEVFKKGMLYKRHFKNRGRCFTNDNGICKIINLPQNILYDAIIEYEKENNKWIKKEIKNVELIKDKIIKKRIILETENN